MRLVSLHDRRLVPRAARDEPIRTPSGRLPRRTALVRGGPAHRPPQLPSAARFRKVGGALSEGEQLLPRGRAAHDELKHFGARESHRIRHAKRGREHRRAEQRPVITFGSARTSVGLGQLACMLPSQAEDVDADARGRRGDGHRYMLDARRVIAAVKVAPERT